jgi:hypothetical protein
MLRKSKSPSPRVEHRRSPSPRVEHRRSPSPRVEHRRSPSPHVEHRRSPSPRVERRRSRSLSTSPSRATRPSRPYAAGLAAELRRRHKQLEERVRVKTPTDRSSGITDAISSSRGNDTIVIDDDDDDDRSTNTEEVTENSSNVFCDQTVSRPNPNDGSTRLVKPADIPLPPGLKQAGKVLDVKNEESWTECRLPVTESKVASPAPRRVSLMQLPMPPLNSESDGEVLSDDVVTPFR